MLGCGRIRYTNHNFCFFSFQKASSYQFNSVNGETPDVKWITHHEPLLSALPRDQLKYCFLAKDERLIMSTTKVKVQEKKGTAAANGAAKKQGSNPDAFQFQDKRPEAIAQRKLQEIVDQSQQVRPLRAVYDRFNGKPDLNQVVDPLQATMNHSAGVVQRYPPKGFPVHSHFGDRMNDYSISTGTVDDIVTNGSVYNDTGMPGATVYYKDGIAVVHDGKQLKTCYPGKVKSRWVKK